MIDDDLRARTRSRQLLLANLREGYYAPQWVQEEVTTRFPQIEVDWAQVNHAIAKEPPGTPPLSAEQWDLAAVEHPMPKAIG